MVFKYLPSICHPEISLSCEVHFQMAWLKKLINYLVSWLKLQMLTCAVVLVILKMLTYHPCNIKMLTC